MIRTYTPEVRDELLRFGTDAMLTPLHVPFSKDQTGMLDAEVLDLREARLQRNKRRFNAIGSRILNHSDVHPPHLPVLDVDGGVDHSVVQRESYTSYRLIMKSARRGSYLLESKLPELLGDHGIEYEIFHKPRGRMMTRYHRGKSEKVVDADITDHKDLGVHAIVLRSREPIFDAVPSTQEGHGHAFINTKFSSSDHALLLKELSTLGILSKGWVELSGQEGMGIVRTPWTEKFIEAPRS